MKIGLFTDTYAPSVNGVVTVIQNLTKEFQSMGHEVSIIAAAAPDYEYEENVIAVPSIPFPTERTLRFALRNNPQILREIRHKKFDIIHSHTEFPIFRYAKTAAGRYKIPLVHTTHTLWEEYFHYLGFPKGFAQYYVPRRMRRLSKHLQAMIVPSSKMMNYMKRYGLKIPLECIPNGIDLSPFKRDITAAEIDEFRKKYQLKPENKVVVFVGRLAQEKSVQLLIENFKKVSKEIPESRLLMVGQGPQRNSLEKMVSLLELQDKIIFTGKLQWPHEISIAYKAANCFASCSKTEVHPITFIEAIASGLPVVAYDDPSIADMVIDQKNGYKPSDQSELYKGIIKLFQSPEKEKEFSLESRKISDQFTVANFARRCLDLYQRSIDNFKK